MKTLEQLKKQKEKLQSKIDLVNIEIKNVLSQTIVKCDKCKKEYQIKDLTYLQTMWYESPYSCTGGDTWHYGEGQWKCECGEINRLYNKKEIEKLSSLFKNIEKVYPNAKRWY